MSSDPDAADRAVQHALLEHLVGVHPGTLTRDDISREMLTTDDFEERDNLHRAIVDLRKAGLVEEEGNRILPSRPALHFTKLVS